MPAFPCTRYLGCGLHPYLASEHFFLNLMWIKIFNFMYYLSRRLGTDVRYNVTDSTWRNGITDLGIHLQRSTVESNATLGGNAWILNQTHIIHSLSNLYPSSPSRPPSFSAPPPMYLHQCIFLFVCWGSAWKGNKTDRGSGLMQMSNFDEVREDAVAERLRPRTFIPEVPGSTLARQ